MVGCLTGMGGYLTVMGGCLTVMCSCLTGIGGCLTGVVTEQKKIVKSMNNSTNNERVIIILGKILELNHAC